MRDVTEDVGKTFPWRFFLISISRHLAKRLSGNELRGKLTFTFLQLAFNPPPPPEGWPRKVPSARLSGFLWTRRSFNAKGSSTKHGEKCRSFLKRKRRCMNGESASCLCLVVLYSGSLLAWKSACHFYKWFRRKRKVEGKRKGREKRKEFGREALAETVKFANTLAGNRTLDPSLRNWGYTIEPPRQATKPAS